MSTVKTPPRFSSTVRSRAGFTLIELLIVIGIIGVLVAIAAVLGTKVMGGARARTAADTLRVLDAVLTEFESATNAPAPGMCENRVGLLTYQYAILDARPALPPGSGSDRVKDPPIPSIVRFTAMMSLATSAQSVLKQINSKFVSQVQLDPTGDTEAKKLFGLQIIDPWNNPIRAVHPSFDGGYGDYYIQGTSVARSEGPRRVIEKRGSATVDLTYRRSYQSFPGSPSASVSGDADEGMCANKRMYFYSSGTDGDPGTRADNVYMARPAFPQETAKY